MTKFKPVTHKERKQWIKAFSKIGEGEDELKGFEGFLDFRETFLKNHLEEDIDLDSLPTEEFDKIISEFESKMDFRMGLNKLISSIASNMQPLQEQQLTQKPENST